MTASRAKPPAERLYGRIRGHKLRPRQEALLAQALPRLRFPLAQAGDPLAAFQPRVSELWLEVGFGGGEHALELVSSHPQAGLIACEVFEPGLCSLLSRVVPEGEEASAPLPGNLRVWDDDARLLLRQVPVACLSKLMLMFPDPWPKARHAKRRFVHPDQVALAARAVRPGGEWRIASDDPTYQAWVQEVMGAQTDFAPAEAMTVRPPGWPATRYAAKAVKAGRQPLYWSFIRAGL